MKSDIPTQSKNVFQKNKSVWSNIYERGTAGAYLHYPCEDLVVAVRRCVLPRLKNGKLLDIGFGSGNNLEFLAGLGFDCHGVEVSTAAIKISEERLQGLKLTAKLYPLTEGHVYPFQDQTFDLVVAWHVLSHNDSEGLQRTILEIRRVLKLGGILLATFPTLKDHRFVNSKRIADNTYEFIQDGSNQKGIIITVAEFEKDVREIFSTFTNIQVGYSEITIQGMTNSHWLVAAFPEGTMK